MNRVKRTSVDNKTWYLDCIQKFQKDFNGDTGTFIHSLRKEAAAYLADVGLPTNKDESWRHSRPNLITQTPFSPTTRSESLSTADIQPHEFTETAGQLVFSNGRYIPELSNIEDIESKIKVRNLATSFTSGITDFATEQIGRHAGNDTSGFSALNTAFVEDGAAILIPKNVAIEQPIHLMYVSTSESDNSTISFPRTLVIAEEGSKAAIIESFVGSASSVNTAISNKDAPTYLTNAVCELILRPESEIEHITLQNESPTSGHVGLLHVTATRDCRFTSTSVALGGRYIRRDVVTALEGTGVESTLNGLYLGTESEHIDNFTTVEHAQPDCSSQELYKGVLGGASSAVFRGKIHVHQIAQNTEAFQSNQNLLFSANSDITSLPQLEIYADDVRCSHGSTTGQVDEDAIFYLQARAIPRAQAIRMLTRAFCGEIVDRIGSEPVRQRLHTLTDSKLEHLISERA